MIYFTSDHHFGHKAIIDYCKRPFKDVEEMNEALVENHNAVVTNRDDVYYLGDFAFRDPALWLARLKGRVHHLILGNHDQKRINGVREAAFTTIQDVLYLRWEGNRFFLSHYSHRVWRNSLHGAFHLYGHSHGNLPDFNKSMDVGVDVWDFCPISIESVVEKLKDAPFSRQHDGLEVEL
jgi:calcineurin-like phosphoesterase family protein